MEQTSKGFLPAGSHFFLPMAGSQGYPKMEDEDDCHNERRSSHSPPCGGIDPGRTRNAKALWLVCRAWSRQVDAGVREAGLQTGVAVGQPGDPGGGGWRRLRRPWVLDAPGCSRHLRRDVHGDVQESLEKRLHRE